MDCLFSNTRRLCVGNGAMSNVPDTLLTPYLSTPASPSSTAHTDAVSSATRPCASAAL